MALDPHAARLLQMLASVQKADAGGSPDPQARRDSLRQLAALAGDRPGDGVVADDLRIPLADPLSARRYRAEAAGEAPGLIVYLHGGGWVAGDLETHDGVCRALCRESGAIVLAVDYRRPPEHRFPAAVHDAAAVVVWARGEAGALGAPPDHVALAGDSAGANLAAAATGLMLAKGEAPPDLLLLLCPILDVAPNQPSRASFAAGYFLDQAQMSQDLADYLPDLGQMADPLVSPLRLADLSAFPPTHIHVAEYDPFRDEGLAFGERLQAGGVRALVRTHPGMIHYFYALPRAIPYARKALAEIGAAVGAALG